MLLGYSDNRLSAGTRSDRSAWVLLLIACLGGPRPRGSAAHAAAAPWVPALNGTSAALLIFLYRNGVMKP